MPYSSWLPGLHEFFPPTPNVHKFAQVLILAWVPVSAQIYISKLKADPRSYQSPHEIHEIPQSDFIITVDACQAAADDGQDVRLGTMAAPGRFTWVLAEAVAPINMLYIIYALPQKLKPQPDATSSILGTGLPIQHEILVVLYLIHYLNRAFLTPLVFAPSISPMAPWVALMMAFFQYANSTNIVCWNVYSAVGQAESPKSLLSPLAGLGLGLWIAGFYGNIVCEHKLFELRRGAAKRKAKSEGKATVSYEKVYVIPPPEGGFKYVLYPHYVLEWVEWTGYWILGGSWGLGWGLSSAALWFIVAELCVMVPRAWQGKEWYGRKFGKRAVAGRAAALPFLGI